MIFFIDGSAWYFQRLLYLAIKRFNTVNAVKLRNLFNAKDVVVDTDMG